MNIEIEEMRIILNERMINNDKYVVEEILEFVYPKCFLCKDLFNLEKTNLCYDDSYVCIFCFTKFIFKKCSTCKKYYQINKNVYCKSCMSNCRVYCLKCFDRVYQSGFVNNNDLVVSDVVSDIIDMANTI